jgi:2-hydroxychromene-2-carboxylate isomerase
VLNAYLSSRPTKHALYNAGRILTGGRRRARLYYRADDPYSHLLAQVVPLLKREYGITVEIVPVAQPGLSANPAPDMLLGHALRDAAILAEQHGLSFPAKASPPPEDRVRRAHAVLLEPRPDDERAHVAVELGEAVWRDDGEALAGIVERYGGISGESVRPALDANYEALERAGHYQPGMLHYGGDWYWGVDRLCHLEARLHREGLEGALGLANDPSPSLESAIGSTPPKDLQLDLFISFRSPYSYVALPQVMALRDRHGIDVRVRPVLPMVMRGLAVPKQKRLYIAFDAKREADRLGVPFGHVCDPLGKGIGYCMALFFRCAEGRKNELELAHSIGRGIWSEARDVAHIPDLVALAERAGIGESEVRAAIEDKTWKDEAKANRDALTGLGLWGVPSLRIGGYATWGQDRIALLDAEIARLSS